MKKIESAKLTGINGGWKYASDAWLPVKDYRYGDDYRYSGSYKVRWGGKVAYRVYWRPARSAGNAVGFKYRTA